MYALASELDIRLDVRNTMLFVLTQDITCHSS